MSSTVEIIIKGTDQASKAFGSATGAAGGLHDKLGAIGGTIIKAGLIGAGVAVGAMAAGLWTCVSAAAEAELAQADLTAVLASTGKAAVEQAAAWANAQGKWVEVATAGKDALSAADIEGIGDQIEVLTARLHDQEKAFAKAKKPTESMGVSIEQTREKIAALNAELQTGTAKSMIPMTQALGLVAPVARVTAEMANKLASSLQGVTRFEDDVILSGESMLLTFTNIGANVFPQATEAMLNMAQKMKTDPTQAAIQLGKALNDPIRGITALRRVGVAFTDAQEAMIKKMVEAGDIEGAQKLILKELETEFGGVARAAGSTLAGKLDILKNKFGDVQENIGGKLLPGLIRIGEVLAETLDRPEVQAAITNIGNAIGIIADKLGVAIGYLAKGNLGAALAVMFGAETALRILEIKDAMMGVVDFISANLQPILMGLGAAAAVAFGVWAAGAIAAAIPTIVLFAPLIAIMAAVGLAVGLLAAAWTGNWGGIRDTLTAVWENTLKPALEQLRTWLQVNIPVAIQALKDFWTNTLQPALAAMGAWLGENIPKALQFLSDVWNNVLLPAIRTVWSFLDTYVLPLLGALANVYIAVLSKVLEALAGLWQNVLAPALEKAWDWLGKVAAVVSEKLQPVLEWLRDKALPPIERVFKSIGDAVKNLIDWLKQLADRISKIKLPDWLTPGSATPFELGLRGIADAMRDLARLELPRLQAALSLESSVAGGGMGASMMQRSTERIVERGSNEYHLHIHSSATTENLPGDFAMLQAMAGA